MSMRGSQSKERTKEDQRVQGLEDNTPRTRRVGHGDLKNRGLKSTDSARD